VGLLQERDEESHEIRNDNHDNDDMMHDGG